jgi:hypothetical protein
MVKKKINKLSFNPIKKDVRWAIENDTDDLLLTEVMSLLESMGYTWCNGKKLTYNNRHRKKIYYLHNIQDVGLKCCSNLSGYSKKHKTPFEFINDKEDIKVVMKATDFLKKYGNNG